MEIEKKNNYPVIETDRFIMRGLRSEDVMDIHDYYSDQEVMMYTQSNKHVDVQQTTRMVGKLKESYSSNKGIAWCIELKSTGKVIGNIGIFGLSQEGHKAQIGFTVSRKYWNQGIGTEMIEHALSYGIREMNINRIEATCKKQNIASGKAMEKAGMKLEGILRDYSLKDGQYYDVKIYSIIESDMF